MFAYRRIEFFTFLSNIIIFVMWVMFSKNFDIHFLIRMVVSISIGWNLGIQLARIIFFK